MKELAIFLPFSYYFHCKKKIDDPHYLVVTPVANSSEGHCSGSEGRYVCHRSHYHFLQCTSKDRAFLPLTTHQLLELCKTRSEDEPNE